MSSQIWLLSVSTNVIVSSSTVSGYHNTNTDFFALAFIKKHTAGYITNFHLRHIHIFQININITKMFNFIIKLNNVIVRKFFIILWNRLEQVHGI